MPGCGSGGQTAASSSKSPFMPLQGYKAAEQELQRHLSLNELYHPVPYSFEPIKILYKGLAEALQSTMKVSLDVRLKESEFQ